MKKNILFVLLLLSTFTLLTGCGHAKPSSDADTKQGTGTPVTLTSVSNGPLTESVELNAVSAFLLKSYVKSSANGYIISSFVQPGQYVSRGARLFVLRTKEAQNLGNAISKADSSFHFSGQIKDRDKDRRRDSNRSSTSSTSSANGQPGASARNTTRNTQHVFVDAFTARSPSKSTVAGSAGDVCVSFDVSSANTPNQPLPANCLSVAFAANVLSVCVFLSSANSYLRSQWVRVEDEKRTESVEGSHFMDDDRDDLDSIIRAVK